MKQRLIDANTLTSSVLKKAIDDAFLNGNTDMHRLLIQVIAHQPTIEAVPISFIEEQVKLCNEVGFIRGEECYMALIENWREENGTETN